MIVLVSRAPAAGDAIAEVGTMGRMIWRGRTARGALRAAARYAAGRAYRVEFFHDDRFYGAPFRVLSFHNPREE